MINSEVLYAAISENLKNIRTASKDRKISQGEMGEILGLSRSAVANLETGMQKVSLHHIYLACEHFELSFTDILPALDEVTSKVAEVNTQKHTPRVDAAISKLLNEQD